MKKKLYMIIAMILIIAMGLPVSVYAAKKIKAKSVSLSAKAVTLSEGDIVTLTATKSPKKASDSFKWSTSDRTVATVSSKGVVTAVKEGEATITVTTSLSKKKATCAVKVEHYLTESEVKSLIDSQLVGFSKLTLTDVDKEIETKLVASGFITEKKTGEMIKDATKSFVTETQVDKKIADATEGGSSTNWKDGTELKLFKQQLPLTLEIQYDYNNEHGINKHLTITEIVIKKYHNDTIKHNTEEGRDEYTYYPIKYIVTIKGAYDCDENIFDNQIEEYRKQSLVLITRLWSDDWKVSSYFGLYLCDSVLDTEHKTFDYTYSTDSTIDFDTFLLEKATIDSY